MSTNTIESNVAFVTGVNRGIGRALTEALLERGAQVVYAAIRDTDKVADLVERYGDRLVPVTLDVTDATQIAAAAETAGDTTLLINNSGVALANKLIGDATVAGRSSTSLQ